MPEHLLRWASSAGSSAAGGKSRQEAVPWLTWRCGVFVMRVRLDEGVDAWLVRAGRLREEARQRQEAARWFVEHGEQWAASADRLSEALVRASDDYRRMEQRRAREEETEARKVRFNVAVPEDAEVWFEGVKMPHTGQVRRFQSDQLQPFVVYAYTVRVQWSEDGEPVIQTEEVRFRAGDVVNLRFPK